MGRGEVKEDEITRWMHRLAEGDEGAAQAIWERYFSQLVRLARERLEGLPRRTADEEDIALSAMNSFFRGATAGRYPQLNDRRDLWKLLVTITANKALAEARRFRTLKRGGGRVRGESALDAPETTRGGGGLEQVIGREPTPEFACSMAENCQKLLDGLDEETLRQVACYKLEGYTNKEIAQKLDYTVRTVERKLMRIRNRWESSES